MKLCLFGATGLLGSEFKRIFTEKELDFVAPTSSELDLLDHAAMLDFLRQHKPDLIVHCAAYTNVDGAETDEEACMALNVGVVENLVQAGIPLIHFSTDYVFNAPCFVPLPQGEVRRGGESNAPSLPCGHLSLGERENKEEIFYIPEDYPRDPQSVYARSKAAAEEVLENSNIDWWNIRTSWLWGPGGKNFVSTILELSKTREELSIIDDQIGRPTYAPELAEFVTEHFVVPVLESSNSSAQPMSRVRTQIPEVGHYHLQNQGEPVSWAGWAEHFLSQTGWQGIIKPISTEDFSAPAARPQNSVLKNTKLKTQMTDW